MDDEFAMLLAYLRPGDLLEETDLVEFIRQVRKAAQSDSDYLNQSLDFVEPTTATVSTQQRMILLRHQRGGVK